MLDPVLIPSPPVIDQWSDLSDLPIVETVSRSVPLTTYVRYPVEGTYERIVSIKAALPASTDVATIRNIDKNVEIIDNYLSDIYSRRSLTIPLFKYMEELKQKAGSNLTPEQFTTSEAKDIAAAFVIPLIEFLNQERQDCISISKQLKVIFQSSETWGDKKNEHLDRWSNGLYSDNLIDHICLLIYKLACLEQLNPVKSAIATDISQFLMIAKDKIDSSLQDTNREIRIWILSKHAITRTVIEDLSDTPHATTKLIYQIFTNYLRRKIESDDYINPEYRYVYVNAYIFICRFYQAQVIIETKQLAKVKKPKPVLKAISDDGRAFYKALIDHNPIMLFIFELSSATSDLINPELLELSKKKKVLHPPQFNEISLDVQLEKIRKNFAILSHKLNSFSTQEGPVLKSGAYLCQSIPVALHDVGKALDTIRLLLAQVLSKPPAQSTEDTRQLLPYEKSMLYGLKSYLNVILLTLSQCRATKELIQSNLPTINENITYYIQNVIQEFTRNKLPVAIARNSDYKSTLGVIFNTLRLLLGYITNPDEINTNETNYRKIPKRDIKCPKCGPNLALLELMLSQLHFLINPESEFIKKSGLMGGSKLNPDDVEEIKEFLNTSKNFMDLLQLADILDIVCDQSKLFFREYYLDANKVTFFRIITSLPMLLSDYALKNYTKPELTGSIFYPLSIYDDAASVALRYLHSSYLYEEIKAEGNICLQSIIQLIADSAFHPIRKFASLRSFPIQLREVIDIKLLKSTLAEQTSALRLGVLLSQNSLYLLGCHIQTQDLIGNRINKIFFDETSKIFNEMIVKGGTISMIAVEYLFKMLKKTHKLLVGFGLPILPYEDILANVFCFDTPNSLQSLLLIYIAENLTTSILTDYTLTSNPIRLIPKHPVSLNIAGLHVGPVGAAIQIALDPMCKFISLETFKVLFSVLEEGAICILSDQVIGQIPAIWEEFMIVYNSCSKNLKRIKNPPIIMTASQIFDRFEGAYRNFLNDSDIKYLLNLMGQIGNALAVLQLIDMAFLLKQNTSQQIGSYIFSKNPLNKNNFNESEIFLQFDKEFQAKLAPFNNYAPDFNESENLPPRLAQGLHVLYQLIKSNNILEENSNNLLDLNSLNGFEATWSVLEFILSLYEMTNLNINENGENQNQSENENENEKDQFFQYGEGVQYCAASILVCQNQAVMQRAISIGEKIRQTAEMDFDGCEDSRIKEFLKIDNMYSASLHCAIAEYQPYFDSIASS